MLRSTR